MDEVLEKLRRRDERAFNRLVLEHQDLVIGYLFRMIGNREEALDLAQDVFLAAFRFIDSFRGECSLRSWLIRISQNVLKNHYRYRDRRMQRSHETLDGNEQSGGGPERRSGGSPEEEYSGFETEQILGEALEQLPEDFRECVVLRDFELLSYEDICQITGLPMGTVKSRLFRARSRLAELLEERNQRGRK